ncbi:MAG: DsbC family protein [Burkholderiaceae bacterium]|jgi:thiol:disulfide interchange protein DsbC|nr:DsbC family protein [Burkholderiaceae bacterium]
MNFLHRQHLCAPRTLWIALSLSAVLIAQARADEAEIRKNFVAHAPQIASKIDEIRPTPMAGLYEVRVAGTNIFYTDGQGRYALQGNLLDLRAGRDLTQERIDKLTAVAFDKLPVRDAIKIVRGNGKRQLAVFEDPNCPYCKQFEKDLQRIDNVTVYLFLYPILGTDSTAKARNIWCAKDRLQSWNNWMQNHIAPPAGVSGCDARALGRNIEFGQKHNITGTPTVLFADGSRAPGALPAAQIEQQLNAAQAPAKAR